MSDVCLALPRSTVLEPRDGVGHAGLERDRADLREERVQAPAVRLRRLDVAHPWRRVRPRELASELRLHELDQRQQRGVGAVREVDRVGAGHTAYDRLVDY